MLWCDAVCDGSGRVHLARAAPPPELPLLLLLALALALRLLLALRALRLLCERLAPAEAGRRCERPLLLRLRASEAADAAAPSACELVPIGN